MLIHVNAALLRCAAGEIEQADLHALLEGIRKYQAHSFRRNVPPLPVIWEKGTVRVFHCESKKSGSASIPLLIVPSMINKSSILDLLPRQSFVRWLAQEGIDVFLLDWGEAVDDTDLSTFERAIDQRLVPVLSFLNDRCGEPVNALGYCMGGTLLAAAVAQNQALFRSIIFLASPWDFHAGDQKLADHVRMGAASAMQIIASKNALPMDWIQFVFAAVNPDLATRKFSKFAAMDTGSEEEELFIAVEDWLNDGVDLPGDVARVCIRDWYQDNKPAKGTWILQGKPVDLSNIELPALIMASQNDRLVPCESSVAMRTMLPHAEILQPACGHIGMMVGRSAARKVWQPVARWLQKH